MTPTKGPNVELIHEHALALGEFTTPAAMGRRLGFHRVTVRQAFLYGLERGWYETRDSEEHTIPVTGAPSVEYRAVPRSGP